MSTPADPTSPAEPTGAAGIVVGYDGGGDGDLALEWAVATAAQTHASVQALIVEEVSALDGTSLWGDDYWNDIADRARATLTSAGVTDPDVQRLRGHPIQALLDASTRASLLVVGSRGHGRISEIIPGSVSQHLSGRAACPVAVVRPTARPDARRIVVGMDDSSAASRALDLACQRAEITGEKVAAVSGYLFLGDVPADQQGNVPAATAAHLREREQDLATWTAAARNAHSDVAISEEVVALPPGRALADSSADASLVVVGTRGLNAVMGLILGSTSHEVLRHAQCPVIVVR